MTNNKQMLVDHKYYVDFKPIGKGSFGEVYVATCKKTNNLVALKLEEKNNKNKLLKEEHAFYSLLEKRGVTKIPKIYEFFSTTEYNVMSMELLDKDLDAVFEENNSKMKPLQVIRIAIQMISIVADIHNAGIIHRDIKPSNFMYDHNKTLKMIDFGLAKKYMKDGGHIKYGTKSSLTGTARYASINVHKYIEPSRRDDMESIGYILIYLCKGKLPWQDMKNKHKEKHVNYELIGKAKETISLATLCSDLPTCFNKYLSYCRELQFYQKPDYNHLINIFQSALV